MLRSKCEFQLIHSILLSLTSLYPDDGMTKIITTVDAIIKLKETKCWRPASPHFPAAGIRDKQTSKDKIKNWKIQFSGPPIQVFNFQDKGRFIKINFNFFQKMCKNFMKNCKKTRRRQANNIKRRGIFNDFYRCCIYCEVVNCILSLACCRFM